MKLKRDRLHVLRGESLREIIGRYEGRPLYRRRANIALWSTVAALHLFLLVYWFARLSAS